MKPSSKLSRRGMIGCGLVSAAVVIRSPHTVAAKSGEITQPPEPGRDAFIERAFAMRDLAVSAGDQGYGALIVDASNLEIVGEAPSRVVTNSDPTGHAGMLATATNEFLRRQSLTQPVKRIRYWFNVYMVSKSNYTAPELL